MMNSVEVPSSVADESAILKDEKSRHWRVGTLSMGLSLLFLGSLIVASQWKGADVFETALVWWPIVFILLGLEVIIYTLGFKGKGRLYYDVLSIFFVGFLSICCLIFAGISSLGLTQEIRRMAFSVEQSYALPEWSGSVPAEVKRVVIQGNNPQRIAVDQIEGAQLNVFGTYLSNNGRLKAEDEDQLLRTKLAGDTLYILLSEPPRYSLEQSRYEGINVTVAAPSELKVIVRDNAGNKISR